MKQLRIQGIGKIIQTGDFLLDIGEGRYGRVTKSFLKDHPSCVGFEYFREVDKKGKPLFVSGDSDTDGEEPFVVHIADLLEPDSEEAKDFVKKKREELRQALGWAKLCGVKNE